MEKITRHSASAALDMRPDGVLIIGLYGPLTADALAHFKVEIVREHGQSIRAFVADYTRAAIAMSGHDLDAVLDGECGDSAPAMPAAMLVKGDHLALFLGHATRMAQRGIVRRVFIDRAPALEWAELQAALDHRLG